MEFKSPGEIQSKLKVSPKIAIFIFNEGQVPQIEDFPLNTSMDELISVVQYTEDVDEVEAGFLVRNRLGMQHISGTIKAIVDVDL